jgi:CheY-like chemotaxis protein
MPRRLLFVDDEPVIRTTLSTILEKYGYEVIVADRLSCV